MLHGCLINPLATTAFMLIAALDSFPVNKRERQPSKRCHPSGAIDEIRTGDPSPREQKKPLQLPAAAFAFESFLSSRTLNACIVILGLRFRTP